MQEPDEVAPYSEVKPGGGLMRRLRRGTRAPFFRLTAYYILLIAVTVALAWLVPAVERAFITPVSLPITSQSAQVLSGGAPAMTNAGFETGFSGILGRAITTLLVTAGALVLVLPVAGVYMFTKRLRYDPSLVQSIIILPLAVAGIIVIIQNSLALAFGLAGIVGAVRFRNTLKDPKDLVYIFMVIGIGLASGVQALDVALVMSMAFNYVVLTLWTFNFGSIYGGRYGRTGILSLGDPRVLVAQTPEARSAIRKELFDEAEEMDSDGILLIHADETDLARHMAQEAFNEMAKDWRLSGIVRRSDHLATLKYLVMLKKKSGPADLVGALSDRWSSHITAAEYIPFRSRQTERADSDDNNDQEKK
ncbi:MAG TPA: DUF4956 domain-containing protein [Longimicrobiaceae bacterium]|nr:DUF4956 domain-containing protein [Longimicrobiaceae bacterium]